MSPPQKLAPLVTSPSLFQTYMRDTGETLGDLSMPVIVKGRRWGAIRVGFDPK